MGCELRRGKVIDQDDHEAEYSATGNALLVLERSLRGLGGGGEAQVA